MGLFDDDLELDALLEAQKNSGFKPLQLNTQNVVMIFNRCLATPESKEKLRSDLFPVGQGYDDIRKISIIEFDKETILRHTYVIRYLFGQLKSVHEPKRDLSIEDFFKNYKEENWVHDKATLMKFLHCGCCPEIFVIFPFNAKKNDTTFFGRYIDPTLSPKDPKFSAWWETKKAVWEEMNKEFV